jgi:hypothetical protein
MEQNQVQFPSVYVLFDQNKYLSFYILTQQVTEFPHLKTPV